MKYNGKKLEDFPHSALWALGLTCRPTQNAMMNLWAAMAKQRYQTTLALLSVPIAIPSKMACSEIASTTKNPRNAA